MLPPDVTGRVLAEGFGDPAVTEAYFSRTDFFPFCREKLETHDPHACRLLSQLWGCRPEALKPILILPAAPAESAQGSAAATE